jgi:hypothetical protein
MADDFRFSRRFAQCRGKKGAPTHFVYSNNYRRQAGRNDLARVMDN